MNCVNCGALLTDPDSEYCPSCGFHVQIQKKIEYMSNSYYNQGLEKASIRDLSGAIGCLKQSLTFNKRNIDARNLLGLVYFETGEVVAALSEWVISKNLQPSRNLASDYINRLQASANKLDAINETIRRYNDALRLTREGQEDMAAIRLKKILVQNPKLIKGYHLLALIQIKNREYSRARKTLKKAARIDRTNTTTLRFLAEVDEQTGVTTRLEGPSRGFFQKHLRRGYLDDEDEEEGGRLSPLNRPRAGVFLTLMVGIGAGALAFYLLVVPSIRQMIYKQANQQIISYAESLASQGAELSQAQGELGESNSEGARTAEALQAEKRRSESYASLLRAYSCLFQEQYDAAALEVQKVYEEDLTSDMTFFYDTVTAQTGVSGIPAGSQTESTQGESGSGVVSMSAGGDASGEEAGTAIQEDYNEENGY